MAKRTIPKQVPNAHITGSVNPPPVGSVRSGKSSTPKTRVKGITHSTRTRKR